MDWLDILSANVSAEPKKGDFVKDGLLYCGKCNSRKQTIIEVGGKRRKVNCMCQCENEAWEKMQDARRTEQEQAAARRNKPKCTREIKRTLADDDGRNGQASEMARSYCADFIRRFDDGFGICFYGEVRRGKTFIAECIANEIIAKGYKVYMVSAPEIAASASFRENVENVEKLKACDLLIIDDLGVERKTEYIQEIMFAIIDYRNACRLPTIVTTNDDVEKKMQNGDMMDKRIYGRLKERSISVRV